MKKFFVVGLMFILIGCNDRTSYDYVSCQLDCVERGFGSGECQVVADAQENDLSIGSCIAPDSTYCSNAGLCSCYCQNEVINNEINNAKNEKDPVLDLNAPGSIIKSEKIDDLLEDIENETRLGFENNKSVQFTWVTKDDVLKLAGWQVEVWNIPVNGEMLLKMFFEMHDFVVSDDNELKKTYKNQWGWQKENIVCLLSAEIFTEAGIPSGNNLYQLTCGEI